MATNSEATLTQAECLDFRRLAGMMIPPDAEFGVPGADDAAIFDDILRSLGRDFAHVRSALAQLAALSGGAFGELEPALREAVAEAFLSCDTPDMAALGRAVLQCYYRDARVVRALGLEPRAPFPKGHTLEQGDWSLLDVVKQRPKMWRDVA
jgi:hypothetical protein